MKCILPITLFLCLHLVSYAQNIERQVVASGGNDGDFSSFTIGQPVVGTSFSNSIIATQGYQQPLVDDTMVNTFDPEIITSVITFPNPVISSFWIQAAFEIPISGSIQLLSILGESVRNSSFDKTSNLSEKIDVSNLTSTVYILNMYTSAGQLLATKKILIQN